MALIDLTNYGDHPTDPNWLVFRYKDPAVAREMEEELRAAGIPFEVDAEPGEPVLIGVRKRFRDQAVRCNYTVLGRGRDRFIADPLLRGVVLALVGLAMVLAVVGALRS